MTHPLQWFLDRIGKTVLVGGLLGHIRTEAEAKLSYELQSDDFTFRDPHPLSASILTCAVLSCDTCGKIAATEQMDKEQAAVEFEGWERLEDGTVNCGQCKK